MKPTALFCLLALPLLCSAQPAEKVPDLLPSNVVAEHRIGTRGPIYVSQRSYQEGLLKELPATELELVVGEDGTVLFAKATSPVLFSEFLLAAAKEWKYKPFMVDGRPATVRIRESIALQPFSAFRQTVGFPEIREWNSLRITLHRSGCYGYCASYRVEVRGDGSVLFQSLDFGDKGKVERGAISRKDLVKLIDKFRRADYFSLADGYISLVTDNPTYTTTISFDQHAKWLVNYVGGEIGMPYAVTELERAIDELSGVGNFVQRLVEKYGQPR